MTATALLIYDIPSDRLRSKVANALPGLWHEGMSVLGLRSWDIPEAWYALGMELLDQFSVRLGERGRLVLPAQLRRRLGLSSGDRLILTVDADGGFHAVSAREQARRSRGLYRHLAPGRSLADELIAERRKEARREDER